MGSSASSEERRRAQPQPQQQPQQQAPPAQMRPPVQQVQPQPQPQPQPQYGARSMQPPPAAAAPPPAQPVGQAVSEAKTIKNECAVIVDSVKYDPQTSVLQWKTVCLVDAEMEVHVAVRVDVLHKNAMITPNIPKEPPPRIMVPACPDGDDGHEQYLDLSKCREQELTYIQDYPRQFPVVIVLFYKTQDGHHQAEFTMIQLKPTCKVIKQLIRTPSEVYKVEHLFGGEHAEFCGIVAGDDASPTAGATEGTAGGDDEDDGLCVICLTNEKCTVVMPCRHLCLCKECAEELRVRSPKCPVCRGPISQLVAVRAAASVSPQPQS